MNVTIIGAGKTGRGFLARLLYENCESVRFVDASYLLVNTLENVRGIKVEYFEGVYPPSFVYIDRIFHTDDKAGLEMVALSDLIFVSVGYDNLISVGQYLATALKIRKYNEMQQIGHLPLVIITAENAIDPAKKLKAEIEKHSNDLAAYIIAESAVFCSTIEKEGSYIDILSEKVDFLPFNDEGVPTEFQLLPFMKPEKNFSMLLKRKIYTYNCASAAIAYLGALKGYVLLADAANDPSIDAILQCLYTDINTALCLEYGIDTQEQVCFANMAKNKFKNKLIKDTIKRNTRNVMRKLAHNERMIGPLLLMSKNGIQSWALSAVIAAAIMYAIKEKESEICSVMELGGISSVLTSICELPQEDPHSEIINEYIEKFKNDISIETIKIDIIKHSGSK